MQADDIIRKALEHLVDRGKTYDRKDYENTQPRERSIPNTVEIFNLICDKNLTYTEGWIFMICLKLVRAGLSPEKLDSWEDLIAYAGLGGESAIDEIRTKGRHCYDSGFVAATSDPID